MRTGSIVVGAALAASLAANAYLLARPSVDARPPVDVPRAGAVALLAPTRGARAPAAAVSASAKAQVAAGVGRDDADAAPANDDVELGEALLCEIAKEQARSRWDEKRDDVRAALRKELVDAAKQDAETTKAAQTFARALDLDADDEAALRAAYVPVRAARIVAVRDALEREDWGAAYETIRGLYADEDALVSARYGEDAVQRAREASREGRLVVLAIAATYAGRPWEDALLP